MVWKTIQNGEQVFDRPYHLIELDTGEKSALKEGNSNFIHHYFKELVNGMFDENPEASSTSLFEVDVGSSKAYLGTFLR